MAITIANQEIVWRGARTIRYAELTMDSSYLTGGESINAADFGLSVILGVFPSHAEGYVIEMVRSSDTAWLVKFYAYSSNSNTTIEMVSAKNLSAVTIPVLVVGY